ncbi:MAG: two-component regulator propeller domain-containing protein [Acidobacteriota bacterium]|nr:two-component regulator propeller domain-containing protein [Acidobacteriota bacterium]
MLTPVDGRIDPRFERYTVEDGLKQNSVVSLLKDRDGFLWVGTQAGLHRFDGRRFLVYQNDPTEPGSLSNDYVFRIYQDSAGVLWVGTFGGGLNRLNADRQHFRAYRAGDSGGLSNDKVWAVMEDGAGNLWVGTEYGLNRMNPDGSFAQYFKDPDNPRGLPGNWVLDLARDIEGALWVGCLGGLARYRPETDDFDVFKMIPDDPRTIAGNLVCSIQPDKDGSLWLASLNTGTISRMNPATATVTRFPLIPDATQATERSSVVTMALGEEGSLWIGSPAGLDRLDPETGDRQLMTHDPHDPTSIGAGAVYTVLEQNGILWAGSMKGGLNKWNRTAGPIQRLRSHPLKDSLCGDDAESVAVEPNGDLWVGTANGLTRLSGDKITCYTSEQESSGLANNTITALNLEDDGTLWVGTEKGLHRFDSEADRFEQITGGPEKNRRLFGIIVFSILRDRNGVLWVGTRSGLNRMEADGGFRVYKPDPQTPGSLSSQDAYHLNEDRDGNLWVGTIAGGLLRYLPETDNFLAFRHDPKDPTTISSDVVNTTYEDSTGRFWVATTRGLDLMDRRREVFQRHPATEDLPDRNVTAIIEDSKGLVWVATMNGLVRLAPESGEILPYFGDDGLAGNVFTRGVAADAGGRLYFTGRKGVSVFHPENILRNTHIPPVKITGYRALDDEDSFRVLNPGEKLEASYDAASFALYFSVLDYAVPGRNRIEYRMRGLSEDWISAGERNSIPFINLAPGAYTFSVRGSNNHGVMNPRTASLEVVIRPPWWRTPGAYAAYVLAFLLICLAYVRAQRAKLRQAVIINEKLRRVDKIKDEFLANTSHELRTPLNGIIGLAESLLDGAGGVLSESARKNLALIAASGKRLGGLVNNILDFSKLKEHSLQLHVSEVDIHEVVDMVLSLSKPLVGNKKVNLINDVSRDLPVIQADENRLLQIFHNLVGNSIKFTAEGWVRVWAREEEEQIIVAVKDSGIGIPQDKWAHIFESFEQVDGSTARIYGGTGLGLSVTRRLVELHHGKIWLNSKEGKGSTFYFSLPRQQSGGVQAAPGKPEPMMVSDIAVDESVLIEPAPNPEHDSDHHMVREDAGRFRILLVDDEPVNLQVLQNLLAPRGYRVVQAANGPEALERIDNEVDLVLLDIMMPRMSGYEVCRAIRDTRGMQELPVVFLTARDQPEDLLEGFSAGGNDYLTKPFARGELLSRVKTHLDLLDINRNLETMVADRTHSLRLRNKELEMLDGIVRTINRETTLQRVLDAMLAQVQVMFSRVTGCAFLMWGNMEQGYIHAAVHGEGAVFDRNEVFSEEALIERFMNPANHRALDIFAMEHHDSVTVISVKIEVNNQLSGVLLLKSRGGLDASDVPRLDRFRQHALSAISKAGLMHDLEQRNRQVQSSIDCAEQIQNAILPTTETFAASLEDSFVIYRPLAVVSGDFYWYHKAGDADVVAVVDCTGHGIPGAFLSMIGATILHQLVVDRGITDPALILEHLDEGVHNTLMRDGRNQAVSGMDMSICRIDTETITFAGARQPLLLYRKDAEGDPLLEIKGQRRSIGGHRSRRSKPFENHHIERRPGNTLYLMTDGYVDHPDSSGRRFGSKRMKKLLCEIQDRPMAMQSKRLEESLADFGGNREQRDDITVIGLKL